jgi:pilus assembly protein Flp/PilA
VTRFMTKLWLAMRSKKGQSLVEYALILALVAIVVITALTTLGGHASNAMGSVATDLGNAVTP